MEDRRGSMRYSCSLTAPQPRSLYPLLPSFRYARDPKHAGKRAYPFASHTATVDGMPIHAEADGLSLADNSMLRRCELETRVVRSDTRLDSHR